MKNDGKLLQNNRDEIPQGNHREDFDREYGLTELLSISVLDDLCSEFQKVTPISILVLMPDGAPYYSRGSLSQDDAASFRRILNRQRIDSVKRFRSDRGKITIFQITHEFETIGYLNLRI